MGLRETIQKAAAAAIAATGNIAVSANYEVFATTVYSASAGTASTTVSTVEGVKVVIEDWSVYLVDGQHIQPNDRKAIIAANAISGVTPSPQDRLTMAASTEVWQVVRAMTDPASAAWTLQVRRP